MQQSNMIRDEKIHQINNVIQTNKSKGMSTMDDALISLYRKGLITRESTIDHCVDADYVRKSIIN